MNKNVSKAFKFFRKYPGHLKTATDDIADRLNISYEEVAEGRSKYRDFETNIKQYKTRKDFDKEAEKAGVKDEYEKFLEEHNIDPDDVVQVYYKGKAHGTNFTVQTRFDKKEVSFDPVEAFKESIKEYIPEDYSNLYDKYHETKAYKKRLGVVNLFDAHIDKICSVKETDSDASLEKNIKEFKKAFNELWESLCSKQPEKILFPIGNDFFHTNDFTLTTKRGTRQDDKVHTTDMDAFRVGVNLLRDCVDKLRLIAPVVVIPVRGNHDEDRVRYLLECLLIAYENQKDVEVVDTRKPRIYYRYGTWLFGFAHGDKGIKVKEYPSLMSTDKDGKKHWSEINQGVYFLGHVHHEKRYEQLKGKDFRGCKVEVLRATSADDSWHWEEGYTAIPRTAYGFVYDKDGKREQEFKVNI